MTETTIALHRDHLWSQLLPRLVGRVFHVTTREAYVAIREAGAIRPNISTFPSPFGKYQSFFRKRGCVSVFDLRTATPEQISVSVGKSGLLSPGRSGKWPQVYLFLASECFERLVPWTRWKEEDAKSDAIVPHIEAGYPGEVSTDLITAALVVTVDSRQRSNGAPW